MALDWRMIAEGLLEAALLMLMVMFFTPVSTEQSWLTTLEGKQESTITPAKVQHTQEQTCNEESSKILEKGYIKDLLSICINHPLH